MQHDHSCSLSPTLGAVALHLPVAKAPRGTPRHRLLHQVLGGRHPGHPLRLQLAGSSWAAPLIDSMLPLLLLELRE